MTCRQGWRLRGRGAGLWGWAGRSRVQSALEGGTGRHRGEEEVSRLDGDYEQEERKPRLALPLLSWEFFQSDFPGQRALSHLPDATGEGTRIHGGSLPLNCFDLLFSFQVFHSPSHHNNLEAWEGSLPLPPLL